MKAESVNKRRLLIALCVVVLGIAALVAGPQNSSALAQDPTSIETIDLDSWKTRDGRPLSDVMKSHSLAMLVLVKPGCETCTRAQSDLRNLKDRVEKSKIKYFVLMIPSDSDTSKYFSYADSLGLDTEVFLWSNRETNPAAPVGTMPVPSHLLVNNQGQIANKWPGLPTKF